MTAKIQTDFGQLKIMVNGDSWAVVDSGAAEDGELLSHLEWPKPNTLMYIYYTTFTLS